MVFKLGMKVDHCMAHMLMLIPMTLILMQGHSGSAEENNQIRIISTSKQVICIKLATTVGHFLHVLDCDFEIIYMA